MHFGTGFASGYWDTKQIKDYCESLRYVTIDKLNTGKKKVHELEIGEVISYYHIHYGRKYTLKCSIITNEIELQIPGYFEDSNEIAVATTSQPKKRFLSSSNEDGNLKKKTTFINIHDNTDSVIENENFVGKRSLLPLAFLNRSKIYAIYKNYWFINFKKGFTTRWIVIFIR